MRRAWRTRARRADAGPDPAPEPDPRARARQAREIEVGLVVERRTQVAHGHVFSPEVVARGKTGTEHERVFVLSQHPRPASRPSRRECRHAQRDWLAWHSPYDDPTSFLSPPAGRRPDPHPRGARRCAARAHPSHQRLRRDRGVTSSASSRIIRAPTTSPRGSSELDSDNATDRPRSAIASAGLTDVEVVTGDAASTSAYVGKVPADLVLLCGVFGNITDARHRAHDPRAPLPLCGGRDRHLDPTPPRPRPHAHHPGLVLRGRLRGARLRVPRTRSLLGRDAPVDDRADPAPRSAAATLHVRRLRRACSEGLPADVRPGALDGERISRRRSRVIAFRYSSQSGCSPESER